MLSLLKKKGVRNAILFTILIILIYKIGTYVSVPGVDTVNFLGLGSFQDFANFYSLFGGSLTQISIFSIGISPYITATIVVQLLTQGVINRWKEYSKQGEVGRKKLSTITMWITVVLAFLQATVIGFGLDQLFNGVLTVEKSIGNYAFVTLIIAVGSLALTWLGQQITEFGVGNGISMIIAAGILFNLPTQLGNLFANLGGLFGNGKKFYLACAVAIAFLVAMFLIVWFVEKKWVKVPLGQMNTFVSDRYEGERYLPIRFNIAGVIPVIFASAIFNLPQLVKAALGSIDTDLSAWFSLSTYRGIAVYGLLIFVMAIFYAFIQFDVEDVAKNLQLRGNYILGVKQGAATRKYLQAKLNILSVVGAIYLTLIATTPLLLTRVLGFNMSIGLLGTSLIIIVGVLREVLNQLGSEVLKQKLTPLIK